MIIEYLVDATKPVSRFSFLISVFIFQTLFYSYFLKLRFTFNTFKAHKNTQKALKFDQSLFLLI